MLSTFCHKMSHVAAAGSDFDVAGLLLQSGAMSQELYESYLAWHTVPLSPPSQGQVNLDPSNSNRYSASMPDPVRFVRTCKTCFRPKKGACVCPSRPLSSQALNSCVFVPAQEEEEHVLSGYQLSSSDDEDQLSEPREYKTLEEGEVVMIPGPKTQPGSPVDPGDTYLDLWTPCLAPCDEPEDGEIRDDAPVLMPEDTEPALSIIRVSAKRKRNPTLVSMEPEILITLNPFCNDTGEEYV
jgi:hypothetical protein